jgi:hypothetical protein
MHLIIRVREHVQLRSETYIDIADDSLDRIADTRGAPWNGESVHGMSITASGESSFIYEIEEVVSSVDGITAIYIQVVDCFGSNIIGRMIELCQNTELPICAIDWILPNQDKGREAYNVLSKKDGYVEWSGTKLRYCGATFTPEASYPH